jgi:hypothetical protein
MKHRRVRRVFIAAGAVGSAVMVGMPFTPIPLASAIPFDSCEQAIAEGMAPLTKGHAGYTKKLDPDGDGVACLEGSGAMYLPPPQ